MQTIDEIAPGEGTIIKVNGKNTAVYKDKSGKIQMMSSICTHFGCEVRWNTKEKTWDCPCHGSRFAANGKVIKGPAVNDLIRLRPA